MARSEVLRCRRGNETCIIIGVEEKRLWFEGSVGIGLSRTRQKQYEQTEPVVSSSRLCHPFSFSNWRRGYAAGANTDHGTPRVGEGSAESDAVRR